MNDAGDDSEKLRDHDRRLSRLLSDAEAATGPVAWPRVEALIAALVELYGIGLERLVACARIAARSGNELDEQLGRDDVIASLLLLHQLHPVPLEERIARALARVRAEVPHSAALSLVAIEDGVVKLRATDPKDAGTLPTTHVVARAIEREAPELAGVQIEGGLTARAGGLLPAEHLVRGGRS
jgi:hypothetical protein